MTLESLTEQEQAEVEQKVADNRGDGWRPVGRAGKYAPGVRIRHVGQRWPEAHWHGTGIICAVLQRGSKDIELIVAYDKPPFEGFSRITQLGSYHVDLGPFVKEGAL